MRARLHARRDCFSLEKAEDLFGSFDVFSASLFGVEMVSRRIPADVIFRDRNARLRKCADKPVDSIFDGTYGGVEVHFHFRLCQSIRRPATRAVIQPHGPGGPLLKDRVFKRCGICPHTTPARIDGKTVASQEKPTVKSGLQFVQAPASFDLLPVERQPPNLKPGPSIPRRKPMQNQSQSRIAVPGDAVR